MLLTPDEGEIEVCGVDVIASPEQGRRHLGFVPDSSGADERLSVLEYVDFFAAANGIEAARLVSGYLAARPRGPLHPEPRRDLTTGPEGDEPTGKEHTL